MGYQVIARKWRPQSFREVVGQSHVTRTLENAVRNDRVAHAYIFSGGRGVGKTTSARILAKVLNCSNRREAEPCQECDSCREIKAGTALDVIEIDAASNRGIDQIRELREMVQFAPMGGRYKVVLLDEAHMLTEDASNALLKTLEEPPPRVIFIMATTEPEALADTIRSRSQHFHFRPLEFGEISDALRHIAQTEKIEIDDSALAVLARAAEGSLRDSLSLLEQAIAFCGSSIRGEQVRELLGVVREEVLDELMAAIRAGSSERALALIHKLVAEGQNLPHFCREAIRHVRNLLVARVCGGGSDLIAAAPDERPRLARAAQEFSEEDLNRYFEILMATEFSVRKAPDPRLHMELGILRLVNAARLAPLEELMAELSGEARPRTVAASPAPAVSGARSFSAAPAAGAPALREPVAKRDSFSAAQSAAATAPALQNPTAGPAERPAPATLPSAVARTAGEGGGLAEAQLAAIKAQIQEQFRFLSTLIEPVTRWVVEGSEVQLYFAAKDRSLADMLQARDPMEKLRGVVQAVTGQPLRVCVRLESAGSGLLDARKSPAALRAQVEQDPVVREMLRRFGGSIRDVTPDARKKGED
jgi:DNA polymerase-3 subunit gamma/tau